LPAVGCFPATASEPAGVTDVHETVQALSTSRIVVLVGALAAALAGARVGAAERPAASLAGQTLGPRMDFDLAAHPPAPVARLPVASSPVAPSSVRFADQAAAPRAG
jgi:hypothetical protein